MKKNEIDEKQRELNSNKKITFEQSHEHWKMKWNSENDKIQKIENLAKTKQKVKKSEEIQKYTERKTNIKLLMTPTY